MNKYIIRTIIFLFFLYIPLLAEEYVIRTVKDFEEIRLKLQNGYSFLGDTIVIAEDLDFKNTYYYGLGYKDNDFEGTIDGRNNKILNYNSDYPFVYVIGKNGAVKNISIYGKIKGKNCAAIAFINEGTIENCINFADVYSQNSSAGICVFNKGRVYNCYNKGSINSEVRDLDSDCGGVVGFNDGGYIELSGNVGDVYGYCTIGGVAGYSENGTINRCCNTGTIKGGVAAGIVGTIRNSTVKNTYNIGNISLTIDDSGVGGIFGASINSDVSYSFNLGGIVSSKNSYIGSIGRYMENSKFNECLYVSGSNGIGNEYVDTGNYSLGNLIGNAILKSLSGVKGISFEDFSNPKTFSQWNLGHIWIFNDRNFPVLVGM